MQERSQDENRRRRGTGECIHVAGVMNFLRLTEAAGWRTAFLGPAVSPRERVKAACREKADLVGVSYRLTPKTSECMFGDEPSHGRSVFGKESAE